MPWFIFFVIFFSTYPGTQEQVKLPTVSWIKFHMNKLNAKTENKYKNKDFLGTDLANLIADIVFALVGIDTTGPGWLLAGGAIALGTSPGQPVYDVFYF